MNKEDLDFLQILNEFDNGLITRHQETLNTIAKAKHLAKFKIPVLITGETGTGKELFAKLLHGSKPSGSFIAVNCGGIPSELLESEFFGHEKGAFTGAITKRIGYLEAANGGTLFLDEIGELPRLMQCKLLRAIQEMKIRRVGGNDEITINCRFVSATHCDLPLDINGQIVRRDLYYRLAGVKLCLQNLKTRGPEDIIALWNHFSNNKLGPISEWMLNYDWPGNIRELKHCVEEMMIWKGFNI